MKLHSVSCTQFAGLRDTDVRFDSGINVVFGKNESGKSTLVNLIARTLFQNAKLDGRTDKDFMERYFPSAMKGSRVKGDFADGKLAFETDKGVYTLTKDWGVDARCMLSTPAGVVRDAKAVETLLREALMYGEGVYAQLLFTSQRDADHALETLLSASGTAQGKQEIADAVTMAAAECDGVSVDAVGQAIDAKIEELIGKHWDLELDRPVRRSTRWSSGLGVILKAYYDWEDAVKVLQDIEQLEKEADRTAAVCIKAEEEVSLAQAAFDEFRELAATLAVCAERKEKLSRLEAELVKLRDVLDKWPTLLHALETARALQAELQSRAVLTRYQAAQTLVQEQQRLEAVLENTSCPSAEDIASVRRAQQEILRLQNALCGMNLTAVVRMFDGHNVEIRSVRTNEVLEIKEDTVAISEAVTVCVDGVMEMRLSPADVDAQGIADELNQQQEIVRAVFTAYGGSSLEELNERALQIADARRSLESVNSRLNTLLGDTTFESVQTAALACSQEVRDDEAILRDIRALCGGQDIARFLAVTETLVQGYEQEYGTADAAKIRAFDVTQAIEKAKASLAVSADIPEKFTAVADPEAYLKQLQAALADAQRRKEEALTAKTVAAGHLAGYKEGLHGDPKETADAAERFLSRQKECLAHWLHIKEVFLAQKEQLVNNPMVELAVRFARNLAQISDERLTCEFPDADRLDVRLYSKDREVDFARLSEGTKETVSLSFRLAMLDHLFPDGGGVIVLDDPFANMDAERTARSCALLQEHAARHQILFLTCKEELMPLLGGKEIRI